MTFAGAARRRLIAVVSCAVTAVIVVWMIFSLGGSNLTNWVNQVGEEAAAFTAAACCGWRVHRASGRTKLGWLLMAASTASWGIGQTIWCWLQLGDGLPNPFPSAADVGFLAAVPLTIVGVVILTKQVGLAIPSYRLLLD
ncbi:MAG TPA: hypothetical protein VKA15_00750, partial [Isosphaeraceae bacterium]|nr:hypothetical protein [Isosphaeraceae bacterium]